jgi:hypothetical protein
MGRAADAIFGGWQLSNIFVWETGPYLTAYFPAYMIDPSGTGSGYLGGAQQRPDVIGNPNAGGHSRSQWFNPGAFACPGQTVAYVPNVTTCDVGIGSAPIGRFGNEGSNDLVGPRLWSLSSGLSKTMHLTESVSLRFEATFTNVLNHTNPADPNLLLTDPNFGKITTARGSDFGGNRTGQASLKIEF